MINGIGKEEKLVCGIWLKNKSRQTVEAIKVLAYKLHAQNSVACTHTKTASLNKMKTPFIIVNPQIETNFVRSIHGLCEEIWCSAVDESSVLPFPIQNSERPSW